MTGNKSPITAAALAGGGMVGFYITVLVLLGGWQNLVYQFSQSWWLAIPIVITFSLQVYLGQKQKLGKVAMASGTGSGLAMVACCAHHVAEFLPFLGLFSAAAVVVRYQIPVMAMALVLNILGLVYLVNRSKIR